ncbi:hypothetical protein IAR50_004731 [Cryptococcus sp. DSM 104548]
MASVHPSRMGLVPGGNQRPPPPPQPTREDQLKQQLLERRARSDKDDRRDGGYSREKTKDRSDRDAGSEDRHGRDRDRDERQDRDPRGRDEAPHRSRRASPSYQPYDHNASGNGSAPPQPAVGAGFGYGRRDDISRPLAPQGSEGPGPGPGGYRGWQNPPPRFSGPVDFEKRRQERIDSDLSIWPPSPKEPYMDEDELEAERKKRKSKSKLKSSKSKKRSKRSKYSSDSDSTDSEEERRRRRRRRERERERDGDRDRDRVRDRERKRDEGEDEDRERRRKRRRSRSEAGGEDEQWIEKSSKGKERVHLAPISPATKQILLGEEEEDDVEVGPQLPREINDKVDRSAYAHMLRGEGEAMAAYAESGQRIPRRGEIGLEAEQITNFESSGYVMSGSRHQRMNAVRMRKENQVINEAEKRALLKLQREDRQQREGAIVSQFKEMMDENLKKQGGQRN